MEVIAMRSVGVRELKARTSQVLRELQASGEEIEVTHHGRVVARLIPVGRAPARRRTAAAWSTLDQVAREIGARWPKGRSASTAVREGRRDL
jgi:prevent-host-death family protein